MNETEPLALESLANPYDHDVSVFSVLFVRALIAWNLSEQAARTILIGMSGGGAGALASVAQLSAAPLHDALKATADTLQGTSDTETQRDHLLHFCAGLDRLRAYRNFYVHSLRSMGRSAKDPTDFGGQLIDTQARGKIKHVLQAISTRDLSKYLGHVAELQGYGFQIARHFAQHASMFGPAPPKLDSLAKPAWPEGLSKTSYDFNEVWP